MSRIIDPKKFVEKMGQTPPPEYQKQKEDIAAATRLLEFRCSIENREPTEQEIKEIVWMKLELDRILADWIDPIAEQ